jgi:hypothetical protein
MLDVDANGDADALTDGVLVLRYLFGFTGAALVQDALGPGAARTDPAEIAAFLDAFNPAAQAPSPMAPLAASTADGTGETGASAGIQPIPRPPAPALDGPSAISNAPQSIPSPDGKYDPRPAAADRVMASGGHFAELRDPLVDDTPTAAFRHDRGFPSPRHSARENLFAELGA